MTDELPPIHELSRLDAYARGRRRVALLNASWRPIAAGAVGAALVIGAVYVTLPKISYREIEVPRVTMRDVEVPAIVTKDVEVPRIIQRDVEIDVPRVKEVPIYVTPTTAPATRAEETFRSRPEYESAQYKGRLVADPEGRILFDTGAIFRPVKYDPATGRLVWDHDAYYDTGPYLGDWAFCNEVPASENLFKCLAIHHDVIVDLATTHRSKGARS